MVQRANVASNSKWSSRKNIPYIASDSWVLRCNLLMRVNGFQSALCVILQYMDTGGKNRYPGVLLVGVFRFAKDTLHVMLEPRWCGAAGAEEGLCKRSQTQQPYQDPHIQSRLLPQDAQIHKKCELPNFLATSSGLAIDSSLLLLSNLPSKQWRPQTQMMSKKKPLTYSVETTTHGPGAAPMPGATSPSTETVPEQ